MSILSIQFANLKSIKQIIKEFQLQPNKLLGQNFLLDGAIPDKMVLSSGDLRGKLIVEVGSGPGILTRSILASGARKLIAIEMDRRCIAALASLQHEAGDRLEVIQQDAAHVNWQELMMAEKYSVIANLPYNIATQLVLNWLGQIDRVESITVMLQREVAQRFCALPSCRSYGRLSVLTQARWHAEILFEVAAEEFFPPPKVTSAVICFTPNDQRVCDEVYKKLESVCAVAFANKRKMVKTGLGKIFTNPAGVLEKLGARPDSRAEQLTVQQYIALAEMVS